MPRVNNFNLPPESAELWEKSCVFQQHWAGDKVDRKYVVYRKRNFTSLIARSPFQSIANKWDSLTAGERDDWDYAGSWAGMSGWDLFVMDTQYRLNNGLLGLAIPSGYHQFKVGKIEIPITADQVKIQLTYSATMPWQTSFYLNVKSILSSLGAGSYANLNVTFFSKYYNGDFWEYPNDSYDFDLTEYTDWDYIGAEQWYEDVEITSVVVTIDIYKMSGLLYIDGMEIDYNSQNYAPDFQFDNFPNLWQIQKTATGVEIASVYPPDDI